MRFLRALVSKPSPLLLPLLLAWVAPAGAMEPAVARARYSGEAEVLTGGTVFFLSVPGVSTPVAVGAAHSFDLERMARADLVDFHLGYRKLRVGVSSRYLVPPGRPFSETGATLADDHVVFRLDAPPTGVRVLEPDSRPTERQQRVRLLGIPLAVKSDEDDIFGSVREVSATRIEIDLDVPADLRGWGGAPVLSHPEGRVVGLLQAAWPTGSTLRVAAAPIASVLEAAATPLAGGEGKHFSAFRAASPQRSSAGASAAAPPAPRRSNSADEPPRRSLLGKNIVEPDVPLIVEIEHPGEGDILGDPVGAFVAGQAIAPRGDFRRLDVVVVIDTSGSTGDPTGVDVNGNGVIGKSRLGAVGKVIGLGDTDPGDSILAAEVAAARKLVRSLDPRATRVGLVTFAGEIESNGFFRRQRNPVITEVALTTDYAEIEGALDRIVERGPKGATNMAAGVNQATIELLGAKGALSRADSQAEKVVLFFTDGFPTLPYGPTQESDNVKEVFRAADLAKRADIRFFTFGIGEAALTGPIAIVELAGRTHGYFTPIRDPGNLLDVIEEVDFANVEELRIVNRTTGEATDTILKNADGSFSAFVPLEAGLNEIEVHARSSDGHEATDTVTVSYAPGAPDVPVPRALLAQRNRLLEQRLVEIQRDRIEAERAYLEQRRKELKLEIEREREAAEERAERQRKELDLTVEEEREAPSS